MGRRWVVVTTATVLLFCVAVWGGLQYLRLHEALPLKKVIITGAYKPIGEQALESGLMPFLDKGFFNVNAANIRQWIQSHYPSVSAVSIHYIGFDGVRIHLQQYKPIAKLPDGELLSVSGHFYKPVLRVDTQQIPLLKADKSNAKQWVQQYQQWQARLQPLQLSITAMQKNTNGWLIQLNGDLQVMLGREHVAERFERFIATYSALLGKAPKGEQLAYIDLRYHHGFAARWEPVKK